MECSTATHRARKLLYQWLARQVPEESLRWLSDKTEKLAQDQLPQKEAERLLFTTFSAIPRYTSKADAQLTVDDLQAAELVSPGWNPTLWSLDQLGRSLLLTSLPANDSERYHALVETLFSAADVHEQIALYQSLTLLPHPERFVSRAAEGLRTSIDAVFNAIALNNPFPAKHFGMLTWNQMILKAVFVGSPLYQIQQLDQRANDELARMLSDYAHERWAAKRTVTPELWRLVGPCLNEQLLGDLQQVIENPDKTQQLAAALACKQSSLPSAKKLLSIHPKLDQEVEKSQLDWDRFSQAYLAA